MHNKIAERHDRGDPADTERVARIALAGETASANAQEVNPERIIERPSCITPARDATPVRAVSVVIPAFNESANLPQLIAETSQALDSLGIDFEIVVVDDASVDDTAAVLARLAGQFPALVTIRVPRNQGQSAAICRGVLSARFEWIGTLDGDGQNVPADFVRMIQALANSSSRERIGMLAGQRVSRSDTLIKRLSSRVANAVRARILGDGIPDTGCGIKLFRRSLFLTFPCFDHMHRFLPALTRMHGMEVLSVPVRHRPRQHGKSNYGLLDRLLCGIPDLLGVAWLKRRTMTGLKDPSRKLEP